MVSTIALSALGFFVPSLLGSDEVGSVVFLVGLLIPLVYGIVLVARHGSPARRGLGLGLIIGWALAPVISAGVCTVFILGLYAVEGS